MKATQKRFLGFALACALILNACGNQPTSDYTEEIEVEPDKWLTIDARKGRAWFRCQWNGKTVFWPGDYHEGKYGYYDRQLPVCLQSWKGDLYLIYRWTGPSDNSLKFDFCKLDESGTRFEIIETEDFPRQIATQNMYFHLEGIVHDEKGVPIDRLKIIRELDINHPAFYGTVTSLIWYQLEKGLSPYEIDDSKEEPKTFFTWFVEKYHPISLRTLVKKK